MINMEENWKELKGLIKWKIEVGESNVDPTPRDEYDLEVNKHFLKEMIRIEKL